MSAFGAKKDLLLAVVDDKIEVLRTAAGTQGREHDDNPPELYIL